MFQLAMEQKSLCLSSFNRTKFLLMSFSSRDSEKVSMNAAFPSTLLEREPPQLLDHLKVVVM